MAGSFLGVKAGPGVLENSDAGGFALPLKPETVLDIAWRWSLREAKEFLQGVGGRAATVEVLPADARRDRGAGKDYPLYFVCEVDSVGQAWWVTRGAQRVGKRDLVKVYRRGAAKGDGATVRRAAYLRNGFRPGWGCQHVLAIAAGSRPGSCRVRVAKVGPFLFAPRVEFRREIRAVKLDGKDWRYYDDKAVFLPNRLGTYEIKIVDSGERAPAPALGRTFLTVKRASWDRATQTLHLETEPPPWYTRDLPGLLEYTALIHTAGRSLEEAQGATVIPEKEYRVRGPDDLLHMRARGFVVRLRPGEARLRFRRR